MPTDVIMPALGVAQETGKVLRWLKNEGEAVERGAPIMEIETDKVTVEIEAPASGRLAGLRVSEGAEVPVGNVVAVILAAGEELPAELPEQRGEPAAEPATEPRNGPVGGLAGMGTPGGRRPLASPKARRLAQERGVDLSSVSGSGPHGAVLAADVAATHDGAAAPVPPVAAPSELGSIWRLMAERTTQSWQTVPHFYLTREVDARRLEAWRASARRRSGYENVTHTDLLVKLVATALREHPRVNGTFRDGGIVEHESVNIGIAVAVDAGLVVPVVHEADRLELREIAERRAQLVERARRGKLRPDDVANGTFTLSNLGMFGVDAFGAIVNSPQAAILAVGRIADRVVALDGRPEVRPMCILTVSFDHRVVDGARGAQFLETLADLVEEPAGLVA
jgi:pyruvate dehydrogenase E2 component (dihydrolipoamide acetyltransferase)